MQYFALLISHERDLAPEERAAEMRAYERFHAKARPAIRAGDALAPAATAVHVTGGPDAPVVTDGPFAEAKELVGGYWFIVADSLEDAARIAAQNPCLAFGLELEIRPLEAARARADEVTNETPPAWRSNDG